VIRLRRALAASSPAFYGAATSPPPPPGDLATFIEAQQTLTPDGQTHTFTLTDDVSGDVVVGVQLFGSESANSGTSVLTCTIAGETAALVSDGVDDAEVFAFGATAFFRATVAVAGDQIVVGGLRNGFNTPLTLSGASIAVWTLDGAAAQAADVATSASTEATTPIDLSLADAAADGWSLASVHWGQAQTPPATTSWTGVTEVFEDDDGAASTSAYADGASSGAHTIEATPSGYSVFNPIHLGVAVNFEPA
jgi:hypothetical protein